MSVFVENPEEMPQGEMKEPPEEDLLQQMKFHRCFNVNVSFVPQLNANRYFSDDEDDNDDEDDKKLDIVLLLGAEKKLVDVFGKEYIHSKLHHQGTRPPPVVRQANWREWPAKVNENEESNVLTITTTHVVYELHLKT